MNFETFINNIINSFTTVFINIIDFINPILNNNFIKFVIFLALLTFLIDLLCAIINIIYTILNNKHDKQEIKSLFGNSTGETSKNGGNIKSKDIYW